MNNHHDIIYVEDNRNLDDEESNCFVCEWSIGEKMFINEKPVLPVKDVFVFTKEQLEKFSEIVIADYIDYGEPKKESIGRTINRMQK